MLILCNPVKQSATNAWVLELCREKNLSAVDLANTCKVSLATARSWLRPVGTKAWRKAPEMAVELLSVKTGKEAPASEE